MTLPPPNCGNFANKTALVVEIVDDMVAAWCEVLPDHDEEDRPRQYEDAFRADCARLIAAATAITSKPD